MLQPEKEPFIAKNLIVWARMAGFPFWPARLCSATELVGFQTSKSNKLNQIAVSFLGQKCDKGWVTESSVCDFSSESMKDKLIPKKFKADKDYRAAIVESVRITMAFSVTFADWVMDLVGSCQHEFPLVVSSTCSECRGTQLSGAMNQCGQCGTAEIHWHCFRPRDATPLEGVWLCDKCCVLLGLKIGSLLPYDDSADVSEDAETALHSSSSQKKAPRMKDGRDRGSGKSEAAPKRNNAASDTAAVVNSVSQEPSSDTEDMSSACGLEDSCFVCGQDGKLLLCDFPGCTKVYHQMCILKSYSGSMCSGLGASPEDSLDEAWFCPRHSCCGCGALESTNCSLLSIDLPLSFYCISVDGSYQAVRDVVQRDLRSCSKCPFSLCVDCDADTTDLMQVPLLRCRRAGAETLDCLNCGSADPRLKLARLLEGAWVRMASTRLSLPFLRPLLPLHLVDASGHCQSDSVSSHERVIVPVVMKKRLSAAQSSGGFQLHSETNNNVGGSSSSSGSNFSATASTPNCETEGSDSLISPSDFLAVLEKIRSLKYVSSRAFQQDLNALRCALIDRLIAHDCHPHFGTHKSILGAFDTLLDASYLFLRSKELVLSSAEDLLSRAHRATPLKNIRDAGVVKGSEKKTRSSCSGGREGAEVESRKRDRVAAAGHSFVVDQSVSAEQLMLSLWRKECDTPIPPRTTASSSGGLPQKERRHCDGSVALVTERSLRGWADFVECGEMSLECRGPRPDPFGLAGQIGRNEELSGENELAKRNVELLLSENVDFSQVMENNLQAANLMLGMQASLGRETVSLLEGAWTVTDAHAPGVVQESPVQDETLALLSRLQESAKKTLQLEARLRTDHLHRQRSLLTGDSEVLSVGQVGVLKELKMANDNLRWRLQQRNKVLAANKVLIASLQNSLRENQAVIERLRSGNSV